MARNIYSYLVIMDSKTWYFEDFKSAMKFVSLYNNLKDYIRIYKLVCVNGELV